MAPCQWGRRFLRIQCDDHQPSHLPPLSAAWINQFRDRTISIRISISINGLMRLRFSASSRLLPNHINMLPVAIPFHPIFQLAGNKETPWADSDYCCSPPWSVTWLYVFGYCARNNSPAKFEPYQPRMYFPQLPLVFLPCDHSIFLP